MAFSSSDNTNNASPDTALETLSRSVESLQLSLEQRLGHIEGLLTNQRKGHHTVEEIASMTGRSAYTVRRWINEGRLNAIRLAEGGPRGRLLIPHAELERLVADGRGSEIPASALH